MQEQDVCIKCNHYSGCGCDCCITYEEIGGLMKIADLIDALQLAVVCGMEEVEFVSAYYQVPQGPDIYQKIDDAGNPTKVLHVLV